MAQAAGPLVSGGLSIFGGFKQRQAAKEQALAAEYEARSFDIRAKQIAADRSAELRSALAVIEVQRARGNLDPNSQTAQAIENSTRRQSQIAADREILGERQSAYGKRVEAKQHRRAGTAALIGGFAEGIAQASKSSLFKPGGKG